MNTNPFYLGWNKGQTFIFFWRGANAKIVVKGYGLQLTTNIEKGESPYQSADRLVKITKKQKIRYYSWIKSINQRVNIID